MNYPTLDQVKGATTTQLVRWNRFLPAITSPAEYEVLSAILARLEAAPMGKKIAASKEVGWRE